MHPSKAWHSALLDRLLARLGRSLAAWGDPFLLAAGPRRGDGAVGPATREEAAAVAAALARLGDGEPSVSGLLPAPAPATVNDCRC